MTVVKTIRTVVTTIVTVVTTVGTTVVTVVTTIARNNLPVPLNAKERTWMEH